MKTTIVGDVHGCFEELMELLEKANYFNKQRQLVFVGDLIDKGPDPEKVLDFALKEGAKIVLGNHEEKHLRFDFHEKGPKKNPMGPAKNPCAHRDFLRTREQLLSLPYDAFERLRQCPYYHYVQKDVVILHAGLERGKTPQTQNKKTICRVRNLSRSGKMVHLSQINEHTPFWTECYNGRETIIYGHAWAPEPRITKNTIGIDTGCVYGHSLSAYLLPEKEIISVKAKKQYADPQDF